MMTEHTESTVTERPHLKTDKTRLVTNKTCIATDKTHLVTDKPRLVTEKTRIVIKKPHINPNTGQKWLVTKRVNYPLFIHPHKYMKNII